MCDIFRNMFKTNASGLRAEIARDEWEDYKQRFQPLENILMEYAHNPSSLTRPLKEEALGRIDQQYGLALPQAERRMGSYGLSMTPEQKAEFQRRADLDRSLAEVQAINQIERFGEEQLFNVVGGGSARAGIVPSTRTKQVG